MLNSAIRKFLDRHDDNTSIFTLLKIRIDNEQIYTGNIEGFHASKFLANHDNVGKLNHIEVFEKLKEAILLNSDVFLRRFKNYLENNEFLKIPDEKRIIRTDIIKEFWLEFDVNEKNYYDINPHVPNTVDGLKCYYSECLEKVKYMLEANGEKIYLCGKHCGEWPGYGSPLEVNVVNG